MEIPNKNGMLNWEMSPRYGPSVGGRASECYGRKRFYFQIFKHFYDQMLL